MRLADTRFQVAVIGQRRVRFMRPQHEVDGLACRFSARDHQSARCGKAGAKPAATKKHVAFTQRGTSRRSASLKTISRDGAGAAGFSTKLKCRAGNLGIAGEIELAQMASLSPFRGR